MPRQPNYYAAGGYDRAAKLRKDDAWLATRLDHPRSLIVPVWRSQNLVTKAEGGAPQRSAFLTPDQIAGDPGLEVFLGQVEDHAYFARDLSAVEQPLDIIRADRPLEFADLRRVGPLVGNRDGSLMAYARGILFWHSRHGFCGVCGAA
ncbi:MAG: NUDIX-like domain-containing protein, partial [Stellaceae bacterium]